MEKIFFGYLLFPFRVAFLVLIASGDERTRL